jgi:hypothetical protein
MGDLTRISAINIMGYILSKHHVNNRYIVGYITYGIHNQSYDVIMGVSEKG